MRTWVGVTLIGPKIGVSKELCLRPCEAIACKLLRNLILKPHFDEVKFLSPCSSSRVDIADMMSFCINGNSGPVACGEISGYVDVIAKEGVVITAASVPFPNVVVGVYVGIGVDNFVKQKHTEANK